MVSNKSAKFDDTTHNDTFICCQHDKRFCSEGIRPIHSYGSAEIFHFVLTQNHESNDACGIRIIVMTELCNSFSMSI